MCFLFLNVIFLHRAYKVHIAQKNIRLGVWSRGQTLFDFNMQLQYLYALDRNEIWNVASE